MSYSDFSIDCIFAICFDKHNGKMKKYALRIRIWIDEDDGPFLGIGRVILLENIKETGSITNAAKSMKMSYRQAWQLVEDMNKRASPLVEKMSGGKKGGGAILTEAGENAVREFRNIEQELNLIIANKSKTIKF